MLDIIIQPMTHGEVLAMIATVVGLVVIVEGVAALRRRLHRRP